MSLMKSKVEMFKYMQSQGIDLTLINKFLIENKVMSKNDQEEYRTAHNKIECIVCLLERYRTAESVQMIDYLYTILPIREAKLTIVADSAVFQI